jgi:hypothetical protein
MRQYHISVSALHITNGDCAAGTLRSFLGDRVLITCDVLHDGPAPLVDGDAWHETRARFLADGFQASYDDTRAGLARFDRTLADAAPDDEIVLWFEHDLFDQLLLIRTPDLLVRLKADARYDVNGSYVASGLSRTSGGVLPFLNGAIQRLFEEYPSTTNGLSRSANAVLRELESGPLDGITLFRATQSAEQRPFMGDVGLFDIVRRLATARVLLVAIGSGDPALDLRHRTVHLTGAGREVLAARQDAVGLNGIDEWRGGVHPVGRDRSPWRWDARGETLVS